MIMAKTEYNLGEVFQCGMVKLRVEEAYMGSCDGCYLDDLGCYGQLRDIVGLCDNSRKDESNVIFVKVKE